MAKSRKGKRASRNDCIRQFKQLLTAKFEECPITKRKQLFIELEQWARKELNAECCEMFLTALFECQATQDAQFEIAIDKALNEITKH